MKSAKTLLDSVKQWPRDGNDRATIVVTGWESNPCEPLLLQALANHPGCKRLLFVPVSGPAGNQNRFAMAEDLSANIRTRNTGGINFFEWFLDYTSDEHGEVGELLAHDLTDLLACRGGPALSSAQIDERLQTCFQGPVVPIRTDSIDLYLSGHGQPLYDAYVIRRRHPELSIMNDPAVAYMADNKSLLPDISEHVHDATGVNVTVPCKSVKTVDELRMFMDHHGFDQVVLKAPHSSCGRGIFRIFRNTRDGRLMGECPDRDYDVAQQGERVFTLADDFFKEDMLAMQWLDNSKGDIRAIILNGSCVGAYRRDHAADTWLCNYSQGGSIHAVDLKRDLSRIDRQKLNAVARQLAVLGIRQASVDFLANDKGERFVSEINIGNTDDIVEISKHWDVRNAAFGRLPVADQIAADILHSWRDLKQQDAFEASLAEQNHVFKSYSFTTR